MKTLTLILLLMLFSVAPFSSYAASDCPATLNFTVKSLNKQQPVNLCKAYLGKVILIVNTASKCGFTPQYEGLEAIYEKYKNQGLVVLGYADPLYKTLGLLAGEFPAWNFHKYLIDRNGRLVASFNSRISPRDSRLVKAIEQLL